MEKANKEKDDALNKVKSLEKELSDAKQAPSKGGDAEKQLQAAQSELKTVKDQLVCDGVTLCCV